MKARGYWGSFCVLAFAFGVPMVFLPPALMCLLVTGGLGMYGDFLPFGLIGGPLGGILFGLIAAFLIRAAEVVVPIRDKQAFLDKLRLAIAEIGYGQPDAYGPKMIFRATPRAGRFAGNITVEMFDDSAKVHGPRMPVARLMKKLAAASK